jgi:hypothetical protein
MSTSSSLVFKANYLAHAVGTERLDVVEGVIVGSLGLLIDVPARVHRLVRANDRPFVGVKVFLVHVGPNTAEAVE